MSKIRGKDLKVVVRKDSGIEIPAAIANIDQRILRAEIAEFHGLSEEDAKELRFKSYFQVTKDAQSEEIFRILATTPDLDRDEEIVDPAGVNNLEAYLSKNPVILFAHDHWSRPAVGKAVDGKLVEAGLELSIVFAPTELGEELKVLYQGGFMNAFSIGFIPRLREITDTGIVKFTEWELLEVSAVSVPANANAVMRRAYEGALQKGIELPTISEIVGSEGEDLPSSPGPNGESDEKRRKPLMLADAYRNKRIKDLKYGQG